MIPTFIGESDELNPSLVAVTLRMDHNKCNSKQKTDAGYG
jgi:hypothetical protein